MYFFDLENNYITGGIVFISALAKDNVVGEKLSLNDFIADQDGYLQVFVAYENGKPVWFDDLKISHQPALVVQENHYYPFGLNITSLEKQGVPQHRWQFMGVEKEESFRLNWTETEWRGYDAQIGRFHQIDKITDTYASINPYNYALNNPISLNDPSGLDPAPDWLQEIFNNSGSGSTVWTNDNGVFKDGKGNSVKAVNPKYTLDYYFNESGDFLGFRKGEGNGQVYLITGKEASINGGSSVLITDYQFKDDVAITKIIRFIAKYVLQYDPEGRGEIGASRQAGGVMSTSPDGKSGTKPDRLTSKPPRIWIAMVGLYYWKIYSENLNTVANIVNSLIHEIHHVENDVVQINNNRYLWQDTQERSKKGALRHLNAYEAQYRHESYQYITDAFEKANFSYVIYYIDRIDPEFRAKQIARFDELSNGAFSKYLKNR